MRIDSCHCEAEKLIKDSETRFWRYLSNLMNTRKENFYATRKEWHSALNEHVFLTARALANESADLRQQQRAMRRHEDLIFNSPLELPKLE